MTKFTLAIDLRFFLGNFPISCLLTFSALKMYKLSRGVRRMLGVPKKKERRNVDDVE